MVVRRYAIGAEFIGAGTVSFRVWAPRQARMSVLCASDGNFASAVVHDLSPDGAGYFSAEIPDLAPGTLYRYRLSSGDYPDPASRFQPLGPHGPSQLVDPAAFPWSDAGWAGPPGKENIIYEMHVGTMGGTWVGAEKWLPHLARLGVTILEIMPVADFPGRHGWGYDGVDLFAPTRLYGTPDEFRHFVDRAHAANLAVILDVVYNHLGPDGNYLREFSPHYFSDRYATEWGDAINFDDSHSLPVREFFVENARYWIEEFHLDGLRLDATQQIFDTSSPHILAEIGRAVRRGAGSRRTFIVAENEPQDANLVRPVGRGGFALDALWNDDFHHSAIVALSGKNEAYYTDYKGAPQEFVSAAKYGFLYQGQRYTWQKQTRGTPSLDLAPHQFVNFIQNHDQIANSLRGQRIHMISSPGALRTMTALLLLGPGTPMLFQGQEFAASTPFLYFADHHPKLAELVREGRRAFLMQFPSLAQAHATELLFDPEKEETFRKCQLRPGEAAQENEVFLLHRDLIALRKGDDVISGAKRRGVDGAVLTQDAFLLRYFGDEEDCLLLFNLGKQNTIQPMSEPLLAPPAGRVWRQIWWSEAVIYGGGAMEPLVSDEIWELPARSAVILRSHFRS